jgi:hypothetical protein
MAPCEDVNFNLQSSSSEMTNVQILRFSHLKFMVRSALQRRRVFRFPYPSHGRQTFPRFLTGCMRSQKWSIKMPCHLEFWVI